MSLLVIPCLSLKDVVFSVSSLSNCLSEHRSKGDSQMNELSIK